MADLYTEASSPEEAAQHWEDAFTDEEKKLVAMGTFKVCDIQKDCPHIDQYFESNKEKPKFFDGRKKNHE